MAVDNLDRMLNDDAPPSIAPPPNLSVDLIAGYKSVEGWQDTAVVREMTGMDEEFLASMNPAGGLQYASYSVELLKRAVVSIGEIEIKKSPEIIDQLLIGDRDILFLAIIKATYGNTRDFKVSCPHCRKDNDLVVDIEKDFPIVGTAEMARKHIEVTLRDGETFKFRLPNAEDSKRVAQPSLNGPQQNTLMISRCLVSDKRVNDPLQWAKNLSVGDRSKVINAIFETKVGPEPQEVNAPCAHCGEPVVLMLDWVSLLFG